MARGIRDRGRDGGRVVRRGEDRGRDGVRPMADPSGLDRPLHRNGRTRALPNPFYYFVPVVLGGFIPWTLYLQAFAAWTYRRGALPDPLIFSLCWFAVTLVFFSASRGRCFIYMLPGFPALAAANWFANRRLPR